MKFRVDLCWMKIRKASLSQYLWLAFVTSGWFKIGSQKKLAAIIENVRLVSKLFIPRIDQKPS